MKSWPAALLWAGLLSLCGGMPVVAAGPEAGLTAQLNEAGGSLDWQFRGRTVLVYAFATNQWKPYVRELHTLAGDNVLRDAPADHLHHHGLMFAVRVNGVNFWEETDGSGRQVPVGNVRHRSGRNARGLPVATLAQRLLWLPAGGPKTRRPQDAAVLVERRTLTLTVDEAHDEVALAWHAEFQLGGLTNDVTLQGTDYNGLGLRLPAQWDRAAVHSNSEGAPYPTAGERDVFPARWGAVSHSWDGRSAQVILASPVRGQAGEARFFSMTRPFTYLSATQGLDRSPIHYQAGDHFQLNHLVLVHSRPKPPEAIGARYEQWLKTLR